MQAQGLRVTAVALQAAAAVVPSLSQSGAGIATSAIVGMIVAGALAVLLALGCYWACIHRQCCSRTRKVAAVADGAQPKHPAEADPQAAPTAVKPFYEAPRFAQTYARQPSLVQQQQQRPMPGRQAHGVHVSREQHAGVPGERMRLERDTAMASYNLEPRRI